MGSLWYHGHTICVSQGLTLSTTSLVTNLLHITHKKVIDEVLFFRNNDGFITKQEMLNATKKLTEKQVAKTLFWLEKICW